MRCMSVRLFHKHYASNTIPRERVKAWQNWTARVLILRKFININQTRLCFYSSHIIIFVQLFIRKAQSVVFPFKPFLLARCVIIFARREVSLEYLWFAYFSFFRQLIILVFGTLCYIPIDYVPEKDSKGCSSNIDILSYNRCVIFWAHMLSPHHPSPSFQFALLFTSFSKTKMESQRRCKRGTKRQGHYPWGLVDFFLDFSSLSHYCPICDSSLSDSLPEGNNLASWGRRKKGELVSSWIHSHLSPPAAQPNWLTLIVSGPKWTAACKKVTPLEKRAYRQIVVAKLSCLTSFPYKQRRHSPSSNCNIWHALALSRMTSGDFDIQNK